MVSNSSSNVLPAGTRKEHVISSSGSWNLQRLCGGVSGGKILKKCKSFPRAPPSVVQKQRAYRKLLSSVLSGWSWKTHSLPGGCALSQLPINPFLQPTFFISFPSCRFVLLFFHSRVLPFFFFFGREKGRVRESPFLSSHGLYRQLSHQLGWLEDTAKHSLS